MFGSASSKLSLCPEFATGRNVAFCNKIMTLASALGLSARSRSRV